jgi:hypothetical protein
MRANAHRHEHAAAGPRQHEHAAAGPHHHEHYAARPHPEFVVLDIGEDAGALIIHTDPEMHGVEVEISPAREDSRRSHKEVLQRAINGQPAFTAVFDGLSTGSYTLWVAGEPRARGVRIAGGQITELDWSRPFVAA